MFRRAALQNAARSLSVAAYVVTHLLYVRGSYERQISVTGEFRRSGASAVGKDDIVMINAKALTVNPRLLFAQ